MVKMSDNDYDGNNTPTSLFLEISAETTKTQQRVDFILEQRNAAMNSI